jgi:hypothetical protein
MREKTRVENLNPVTQSPQTKASVNVNQNRSEKAGQTKSFQPLPNRQEGKAFSGRPSLPEGKPSPAPTSKGQVIQNSGGTKGGFWGAL